MNIIKICHASKLVASRLHQCTRIYRTLSLEVATMEVREAPYFASLSHYRLGLLLFTIEHSDQW